MTAMMTLGLFAFSLPTAAYQELQRRTSWRHGRTPRVGARAASQFQGPDEDTITVSGLIAPGAIGKLQALQDLRDMGDEGLAWPLVTGYGENLGAWKIDSVDETQTIFMDDGRPRKADFTVTLHRVDDADARHPSAPPPPRAS